MRRRDPRLLLAGAASVALAALLSIPDGHLGSTSAQHKEALAGAPDVDACRMLDDFLGDRDGDLPTLQPDADPPDNEAIALRLPPRGRDRCGFEAAESPVEIDHVRMRSAQITVTTMSTHQGALDRLSAFVAQTDLGPGAVRSVEDGRATLGGFLADDHSSWQIIEHYVVGTFHVGLFITFDQRDQKQDEPKVLAAIDAIVDQRLDPSDYLAE